MGSDNSQFGRNDTDQSPSKSVTNIIIAILTVIAALALGGWGSYNLVRKLQSSPKYILTECQSSIKKLERNLSKHAA